jgi:hypothetical protein
LLAEAAEIASVGETLQHGFNLPQDLLIVRVGAEKAEKLVEAADLLDSAQGPPFELAQKLQAARSDILAIAVPQLVELL